jgi:hypothetical protein
MNYYIKKLTANDLGIRDGIPKVNPYILVSSKTRGIIFPDPPREPKNESFTYELFFQLPLLGNNQKILFKAFNNNGTLYLAFNKKANEIGVLPDDIIVIKKLNKDNYYQLDNYRPGSSEYDKCLLKLNGKKSLVTIENPSI